MQRLSELRKGSVHTLRCSYEKCNATFSEICDIEVGDDITFVVKRTDNIRENADYQGLRVHLEALYPPMTIPLKIDITTGDKITPREIVYEFSLMFEPRKISVLAYNLETILAEKLETILSRGDQNTRPRDFYDVFILRNFSGEILMQRR